MVRRSLGGALWFIAGLLAVFLGVLSGLTGTTAGRTLLARAAEGMLARVLVGSVHITEVGGPLLTGVVLHHVSVADSDGTPVATIARLEASYTPFDLSARRVVLQELVVDSPAVTLVQHRSGRLNVEELIRHGTPGGPPRAAPLVVFRNVRIRAGDLVLRLQDRPSPDDSAHEIRDGGPDGRWRVRRFADIGARVTTLRLAAPRQRGVRVDVDSLGVAISDPPVRLRELVGRATILGDTLDLDLPRVRLPASAVALTGRVAWPRDTVLYALDVVADSATLVDLSFLDPRFSRGAVFRGAARVRSRDPRTLEVRLDPFAVSHAGGRVAGRLTAVSVADTGLTAVADVDLTAANFDLEFARPFLDTLPFAGRLTGRTRADGPLRALSLDVDWTFRDSLVAAWPASTVAGRGTVDLGGPQGLGFHAFAVDSARVDLGTVRRLIPAFRLAGTLDAQGVLDGTLTDARFQGLLRHRDGTGPVSAVTGTLRLDSRTDTLGIDADVELHPLALPGLRGSFPGLVLEPALTGRARLHGRVDSLATDLDLHGGAAGSVRAVGALTLLPERTAARGLVIHGSDVDLSRWRRGAPDSRLVFTAQLDVGADTGGTADGGVAVDLGPSLLAGTALDSGVARLHLTGGRLRVDTLLVTQPGLRTTAAGELGLTRAGAEPLALELDADSLGPLDSLVVWGLGRMGIVADSGSALAGSARIAARVAGRWDSLDVRAEVESRGVRWRDWYTAPGRALVELTRFSAPRIRASGTLDSLAFGRYGFGGPSWSVAGRLDSLAWFARMRVGERSAVLGGGRYAQDSTGARTVALDSLAVLLPGEVWYLEAPATVVVSDSVARADSLAFRGTLSRGRVRVAGDLPVRGPANAAVELEDFPLAGVAAVLQWDGRATEGELSGSLRLTGSRAAPIYAGGFTLREATLGEFHAPLVTGTFGYRERMLSAEAALRRGDQRLVDVTARLPLDLSLEPVAERQLPQPLTVRATADRVELAVLEALTNLLRDVHGTLTADVGIAGTWDHPVLRGQITVDDAAATIPTLNVRYEDIAGRLSLGGDTIRVDTLSLRSGEGTARVRGHVRLERLTRPVLGLAISADRFLALDLRNEITVAASGDLALTGRVYGATLSGRGTVTRGVWYFRDALEKRVVDLDEPWVKQLIDTTLLVAQQLEPEFQSRFLDSLRIRNLDLTMGSDVWLRSSEANVQLTGTLRVDKEADLYRLRGTLQAPRGVYRLVVGPVTREFVVTQGTVRWFGTPDLDAALDIEARHVVRPAPIPGRETGEDITVIARIRGTLLVPRLSLESAERRLPQTELISYLMFGVPSVAVAAGEGESGATRRYLLSSAVSSLVSGELARALVSDLGVPLDYVEIRPGSPSDPFSGSLFAAGWQIGPRTFLIVNAGFCQGRPVSLNNTLGASVQYRMSAEWRTEASFEPFRTCLAPAVESQSRTVNRQLGLDLFWERRF